VQTLTNNPKQQPMIQLDSFLVSYDHPAYDGLPPHLMSSNLIFTIRWEQR
jgi:hypothetical protein